MEEQKKEEGTAKQEILFFHGTTNLGLESLSLALAGCNCDDHNRFTLAAEVDTNQMRIAIAICSTSDHFSKAEGRKLATVRLQDTTKTKGKILIFTTIKKGTERRVFNRFAQMLQTMSKSSLVELFNLIK